MASLFFMTLYDEFALGIRCLSSYLEQCGHVTHLCFLKEFKVSRAPYLLKEPRNYQTIHTVNEGGVFTCSGVDANPWTKTEEKLLNDLVLDIQPDIICISIRNFIDEEVCRLFRTVKHVYPNAVYVAGGFGPTFIPEKYLEVFDYVVCGEGEGAILEIAESVDKCEKERIKQIKNVSYIENGKYVRNPLRPLIENLDELPFPKLASEGNCYFIEDNTVVRSERAKIYSLLIGRGCLNNCSYCCAGEWRLIYRSFDMKVKPYRQRSIDGVLREIRRAGENGFRIINIADSFLAITPEQQRMVFAEIKKYNIRFSAQFHPELALKNPEIVQFAHECGLRTTVVGVQHGSERFSREVYNRKNSNKIILQWARLVNSLEDVEIQYHFITGNPLETSEDFEEHLEFVRTLRDDPAIRIDEISFNILKLFPNTSLTNRIAEMGLQQSAEDAIYKSCLSILRLALEDDAFLAIYRDAYYKEQPFYLIPLVYETQMKLKHAKLIAESNPSNIIFDLVAKKIEDIPVSKDVQSLSRNDNGGLVINASGNDPWLLLQDLPLNKNKRYSCQCAVESPSSDSILQLFYQPLAQNGGFSEENSISIFQHPGENFNRIIIEKNIKPELRLDVGNTPGTYHIRYFVIRDLGMDLCHCKTTDKGTMA